MARRASGRRPARLPGQAAARARQPRPRRRGAARGGVHEPVSPGVVRNGSAAGAKPRAARPAAGGSASSTCTGTSTRGPSRPGATSTSRSSRPATSRSGSARCWPRRGGDWFGGVANVDCRGTASGPASRCRGVFRDIARDLRMLKWMVGFVMGLVVVGFSIVAGALFQISLLPACLRDDATSPDPRRARARPRLPGGPVRVDRAARDPLDALGRLLARSHESTVCADSRMTSPWCPVRVSTPEPGMRLASTTLTRAARPSGAAGYPGPGRLGAPSMPARGAGVTSTNASSPSARRRTTWPHTAPSAPATPHTPAVRV